MGLSGDVTNLTDEEDQADYARALVDYPRHCEEMEHCAPLVMHVDPIHGGKIAYLGFVNGDGNIPIFVRALLTGTKTN